MSSVGERGTSPQYIDGRGCEKCLESELLAANVARSPHLTRAHRLRNRAFNSCSFGVQRPRIRECPGVCAPSAEQYRFVHLGAKSALSWRFGYIDHAEHTLDTQEEETEHEGLASRADQGYAPNLDWFAQQGRPLVWPPSQ